MEGGREGGGVGRGGFEGGGGVKRGGGGGGGVEGKERLRDWGRKPQTRLQEIPPHLCYLVNQLCPNISKQDFCFDFPTCLY